MECQVLYVREAGKNGFRVAHVSVGGLFGDLPAADSVKGPGPGVIRSRLTVTRGRLECRLQVLEKEGS